ncbi:uncharacterized protein L203_104536 [Cryptococcus depauperatus CBS 7841]|uniref:Zn(2)-C6 fungal-type domain-containing protein n=1 Tax=Cryptococcus depauperatus CBS 7841 TaxID=1295531 RepID=A0AAJ8JVW7_9TREE
MHPQPGREHDEERYRPLPPPTGSSNGLHHHRSTYPHAFQLPPPIPSAHSPMGMVPPSPSYPSQSPGRSQTDPQGWVSQPPADRLDRPGSRARGSWGAPSPRDSSSTRLPSLSLPSVEFSHRSNPPIPWDAPSPGSFAMGNVRGATFGGPVPRDSSSKLALATSMSGNGSFGYNYPGTDEHPSPKVLTPRESSSHFPRKSSPPPASAEKHPAPSQESNEEHPPQKKKKRRVALSCAECAKRKQKCNRETPCQHCVARRVPELCVPYTRPSTPPEKSGKGDKKEGKIKSEDVVEKPKPSMLPTISVRVARLEAIMNAVVNRIPEVDGTKALKDWRISEYEDEAVLAQPPEDAEIERPASASSSHSKRDDQSADWGGDGDGDDVAVGGLDRATSGRNPLPQSMMHSSQPVSLGLNYHGTPAEQLQKFFEDCGVSPSKVTSLMEDLPQQEFANKLVDWFFEKFNFVRYPIDEHSFRQALETVYTDRSSPSAVLALPLVFIVLSISTRIAPNELIESEDNKRSMSLRMYWCSRSAVIFASAVKAENIQLVETRICSGLYLVLMHERRLADGWADFRSALTIGQAIGLHRDGKKLGLDPYVTEYRRRLWSYLVHADATYSCLLGRPTSIKSSCVDTLPPSNINLPDILRNKQVKPRPMSEPTFGTYLILRRGLGEIVAKITHHFQRLEGPTEYRDVEAIDAEMKQFVANLPPAFSMLNHDRSDDDKLWFLPIHRYYIQTEILHFTIILHRPWLLRRLKSSRYALSRSACFDAAIMDYKIRQAFKVDCPNFFETLLGSSFREFNAAMIAGISLIINPRASYSNDMRKIVQAFMEQHPHDPKADDFSQKEAAIIHTLYLRSQEIEEKRATRRYQQRLPLDNPAFNTSFERTSPHISRSNSAATRSSRLNEQPKQIKDHSDSEPSKIVPLPSPSGSAQAMFKGSPFGTGSGHMTGSPEDDHPQELLDQWIINNTSFGPGADSTVNTGSYPTYFHSTNTSGINDLPLSSTSDGQMSQIYSDMSQTAMAWMDPSLMAGGNIAALQTSMPVNAVRGIPGGNGKNSMQYWNTLIDGIVTTLPQYDPNFTAVG